MDRVSKGPCRRNVGGMSANVGGVFTFFMDSATFGSSPSAVDLFERANADVRRGDRRYVRGDDLRRVGCARVQVLPANARLRLRDVCEASQCSAVLV